MKLLASGLGLLRKRAPARSEILNVLNVVVFVLFGWSIRGFLFEIPSFLLYMGLGDITAILFYMMAFALLESVLVTGGLVIISMLLPSGWLSTGFRYKGFLIVLVATIGFILFQGYYKVGFFQNFVQNDYSPLRPIFIGLGIGIIGLLGLLLLFHYNRWLQKYLAKFVDQFSLFGYIYIPLGVIGILVVLVRNLL